MLPHFTAGIGENSFFARKEICNLLAEALGIEIDDDANVNGKGDRLISTPNSKVKVYVIPTNEELVIARDTKRLLNLFNARKVSLMRPFTIIIFHQK